LGQNEITDALSTILLASPSQRESRGWMMLKSRRSISIERNGHLCVNLAQRACDSAKLLRVLRSRKWIASNPAKEVKGRVVKPKAERALPSGRSPADYRACDELGRSPYERVRARAMVLLLRYTSLRVSDVATLARDRIRHGSIYLHTMKNGKPISLPLPPMLNHGSARLT
jgi:site-specific recombinase XerC